MAYDLQSKDGMKKTDLILVLSLVGFLNAQEVQAQSLFTIDADGRGGYDGSNGTSYGGSAGNSQRGNDGGNAGRSTPGTDAGNISIDIKEGQSQKGVVVIDGVYEKDNNRRGAQKKIEFGNSGYIYLNANGGKGGNGGFGGDAASGGTGYSGSNATQYSSGTNGGPGGNGGNGGDGTPGSHGGEAGIIKVSVDSKNTHLLMLFKESTGGGAGGAAGRNGSGGSGGSGGRGGSSYSWTEQVYKGQSCTQSCSMESNGNGSYTNNCHNDCHDVYETVYHSNPGGSDGYSGSRGRDGGGNISAGGSGRNGQYLIEVKDPDGQVRRYSQQYDLELQGFNFRANANNGIFEPNDTVIVDHIRIRNNGGMPTPPNYNAMVYLNDNRWVLSHGSKITIPKSLEVGESYVVPGALQFKIADTVIQSASDRFRETATILPLSYLEGVNRPFERFYNPQSFQVSFPIEITPLYAPRSLDPGTKARMFWRITNVSTKPFGKDSPVARKIETAIHLNDDENSQQNGQLNFSDVAIKNGYLQEIAKLGPGESTLIEGTISVGQGAPFYSAVGTRLGLSIGEIDNKEKMIGIQFRDFSVRVSMAYQPLKDTDFLLVTNSSTRSDEFMAWQSLVKGLGLKMAVWDLSKYGFLDLSRQIRAHAEREDDANTNSTTADHTSPSSTIKDDFYKRLIVILNNEFENNSTQRAQKLLARNSLIEALTETGIGVYIVGGTQQDLQKFVLPPIGSQNSNFENKRAFENYLTNLDKNKESYQN